MIKHGKILASLEASWEELWDKPGMAYIRSCYWNHQVQRLSVFIGIEYLLVQFKLTGNH